MVLGPSGLSRTSGVEFNTLPHALCPTTWLRPQPNQQPITGAYPEASRMFENLLIHCALDGEHAAGASRFHSTTCSRFAREANPRALLTLPGSVTIPSWSAAFLTGRVPCHFRSNVPVKRPRARILPSISRSSAFLLKLTPALSAFSSANIWNTYRCGPWDGGGMGPR